MSIFERVGQSQFVVPSNYMHQREIDLAAQMARERGRLELWEEGLTSANFASVSSRLIRRRTCWVQVFQITQKVSIGHCLRFLGDQGGLLVGAQGMTLVQRLNPELFPPNKFVYSLDIKTALWADGKVYRPPFVCNFPVHGWRFGLGDYNDKESMDEDCCLLCVTAIPPRG